MLFDVFKELGSGYREKYYQKAIVIILDKQGILFKEQVYTPLIYSGVRIGSQYLDFLIENKIVLEIKVGDSFSRKNIEQIYAYLKLNKLMLGLLANFTRNGVKFKRIVNLR